MPGIVTLSYFKDVRKIFVFLIKQYHFKMIKMRFENMTYITIYVNKSANRKVKMSYDLHDNAFYFYIIRGDKGKYPEPYTGRDVDIATFYDVFKKHTNIPFGSFIPNDKQYIKALELNAEFLQKYGDGILRGKEWI